MSGRRYNFIRDYSLSIGAVILCTAVSIPVRSDLGLTNAAMTYLLGVTITSILCSRGAAILNSVLSVTSFYYFCVPVYGSFVLVEYSFATTLFVMILVSMVITTLSLRVRRQSQAARIAEVAAESERTRSALLSTVSHDLKTPLVSIYGSATTLRDQGEEMSPAERSALIDGIAEEAGRLNRLVTNLVDMTRLEAGIELKKDWQSVEELMGEVLVRLENLLSGRSLSVAIPPDLPLVYVDEVLVQHLLINVVENAAKHTPPGSPISIWGESIEDRVRISVHDRGPGFPKGAETRVFDRFYRATSSGSHGMGLGLSIAFAIVKAHGGSIRATNAPSGGGVIEIELPIGGRAPEFHAIPEGIR